MKNVLKKIKVTSLDPGFYLSIKTNCFKLCLVFGDCCLNTGFWMFYKCRTEVKKLNNCMAKWFVDENFIKECRDQYLQERRQYRLTGIKKNAEVQKMKS